MYMQYRQDNSKAGRSIATRYSLQSDLDIISCRYGRILSDAHAHSVE